MAHLQSFFQVYHESAQKERAAGRPIDFRREFRQQHGTRSLSFASAEDLLEKMGLIPGAVTPLGLLNDDSCSIRCFLDDAFLEEGARIGVHPNDNTATVFLPATELIRLLEAHGTAVEVIRI